jgi:hypothetical protein
VSRLATVVGALSAIVSLIDYLAAKSFLSHWLQRQVQHGPEGWQVSPTLNLLLVAMGVALVWLLTESPASDPPARKRLMRLRTNLVIAGLAAWFCLGPSIGDCDLDTPPAASGTAPASSPTGNAFAVQAGEQQGKPIANPAGVPPATHGHTSQFTWSRPSPSSSTVPAWKPGDGLRAMARLFEDTPAPLPQAGYPSRGAE